MGRLIYYSALRSTRERRGRQVLAGPSRWLLSDDRGHPRPWQYDYLLLRPLARGLRSSIETTLAERSCDRVLDVGSGESPYRQWFGASVVRYERMDLDRSMHPTVVARGEAMPFVDESFDAVLSTQVLGLFANPERVGAEITRVLRAGGRLWLSGSGSWPRDSAAPEHRFGELDLPKLVPELQVIAILPQGGLLTLPLALVNVAAREAVIAAERRLGRPARAFRIPVRFLYLLTNTTGRVLEAIANHGPLSRFLGYLHGRMPMNFLMVAEKPTSKASSPRDAE